MSSTKSAFRMLSCLTASVSSQMRSSPIRTFQFPFGQRGKSSLRFILQLASLQSRTWEKKFPGTGTDRQRSGVCVCLCDEIFIDSTA